MKDEISEVELAANKGRYKAWKEAKWELKRYVKRNSQGTQREIAALAAIRAALYKPKFEEVTEEELRRQAMLLQAAANFIETTPSILTSCRPDGDKEKKRCKEVAQLFIDLAKSLESWAAEGQSKTAPGTQEHGRPEEFFKCMS